MSKFRDFEKQLDGLDSLSRRRRLVPRTGKGLVWNEEGRRIVNFGSNDYLGFAASTDVVADDKIASGSGASALVCGWTQSHQDLADAIADFEHAEAAVVFPSGYAACSGVVATLPGDGDLILSDQLNHASLIDGCRLSRAQTVVYPHRDHVWLSDYLNRNGDQYQRAFIVTDSVFSMDGHVAPLKQLCQVADQAGAVMVVDEAHATGVLGGGRGVCHQLGIEERVDVRIGTLSKAIGAQGGFACGRQLLMDYLINFCRPLIYSTSLAPASVRSARRAMEVIAEPSPLLQRVREMSFGFRQRLGLAMPAIEAEIPIIAIVLGSDEAAMSASRALWEAGFYVPAIRPPTVPENTARLRVSLSAGHSDTDVKELVAFLDGYLNASRG